MEVLKTSTEKTEYHPGLLCPGLVNVHCHLELSFAHQRISQKTGINAFIGELEGLKRSISREQKQEALTKADKEMQLNGIVAVGDIMNTDLSLKTKSCSAIRYHNFIETYGSDPSVATSRFQQALSLYEQSKQSTSIVPHAPYSLSAELFKMIHQHGSKVQSMHYAESESEYRYFEEGTGEIYERLRQWGVKIPSFIPSGKSPIKTIESYFSSKFPLILIHNSFINKEDVLFILDNFDQPYFGLCPNANLYIEDHLPPVDLLEQHSAQICIGTDSLASNSELSVLNELRTLKKHFPSLQNETLLQWGSLNGARALGFDDKLGSLDPEKKPGLLLLNEQLELQKLIVQA